MIQKPLVINNFNQYQDEGMLLALLIIVTIFITVLFTISKILPYLKESMSTDIRESRTNRILDELLHFLKAGNKYKLVEPIQPVIEVIPLLKQKYNPIRENYFIIYEYPHITMVQRNMANTLCYECLKATKDENYFQCSDCRNFFCGDHTFNSECPQCNGNLIKFPIQCPNCQLDHLNLQYILKDRKCPLCLTYLLP